MNVLSAWMLSFFHWCLKLYPPVFRCEYNDELELVFLLGLRDAAQNGRGELMSFGLRELRDIPGAILRAHVRERRASMTQNGPNYELAPTGWKWAAYYLPFVFILLADLLVLLLPPLGNYKPVTRIVSYLFFIFILGLALVGILKKLPGWAVPNLGMILAVGNLVLVVVFLSMGGNPNFIPMLDPVFTANPAPYTLVSMLYAMLRGLLFMLPVLVITGIGIWLTSLIPVFQDVYQRIYRDWSLVSLLIYPNFLLTSGIVFDPPAGSAPYKLIAYTLLAAGAWIYLRSTGSWRRLAILVVAAGLAQSTAAAGAYFLYLAPGSGIFAMLRWYFAQAQWVNVIGTLLPLALPALLALAPRPLERVGSPAGPA